MEEEFIKNSSKVESGRTLLLTDGFIVWIGVIVLFENLVAILVLYRCTRLIFQIRILSLNLAVTDFLTGFVLALPNTIIYDKFLCDIKKFPSFIFLNASLLIITIMNIDRYFAFAFAMRYYSFITKKLMIGVSALVWMLSFCLTYGMFFDFDDQYGLSCEPLVYCPRNKVSTTSRSVLFGFVVMNFVIFGYFLHEMRHLWFQGNLNQVFNHHRKPSRTVRKISLIVGLFLVGFFPFITLYAFPILDMTVGIGKYIYLLTAFLLVFNSACKPVIYVLRFTEARYQLKKLVCFWNKKWIESIDKKHNQWSATYEINAISK